MVIGEEVNENDSPRRQAIKETNPNETQINGLEKETEVESDPKTQFVSEIPPLTKVGVDLIKIETELENVGGMSNTR